MAAVPAGSDVAPRNGLSPAAAEDAQQPTELGAVPQADDNPATSSETVPPAAAGVDGTRRVQEGDTIILDTNGERFNFCQMKKGGTVKLGKTTVSHETFIGQPYGAVFDLAEDSCNLKRCFRDGAETWSSTKDTQRNNAELFDLGIANQNLSAEEIAALRAEGKTGAEIMAALEAGSATFANKTEFSQEKYRKKKAKKYLMFVTLIRPTARSICEAYFEKVPQKICSLRVDALAIMLSLANIGANARVLVSDATSGLVTGAILERLGGSGSVVATYAGTRPASLDVVRSFNLSAAGRAPLTLSSLAVLDEAFGFASPAAALAGDTQSGGIAGPAEHAAGNSAHGQQQAASAAAAVSAAPAEAAAAAGAAVANLQTAAAGQPAVTDSVAAAVDAAATAAAALCDAAADGAVPQEGTRPTPADAAVAAEAAQQADGGEPMQTDVAEGAAPTGASTAATSLSSPTGNSSPVVATDTSKGANLSAQAAAVTEPGDDMCAVGGAAPAAGSNIAAGERRPHQSKSSQGVPFASREQLAAHSAAGGFDCCVVAAPQLLPAAVLARLLPLLAPSAPFVVWHPHMQPLAEAMSQLQSAKHALALQLQESWWREVQVLPARTHPNMSMSGTGGYLLSGVKVVPPSADAARPSKKGRTN